MNTQAATEWPKDENISGQVKAAPHNSDLLAVSHQRGHALTLYSDDELTVPAQRPQG
jgi:hypothetical protein